MSDQKEQQAAPAPQQQPQQAAPAPQQQAPPPQEHHHTKDFAKKLGNAATFGAGATVGADLVNGLIGR